VKTILSIIITLLALNLSAQISLISELNNVRFISYQNLDISGQKILTIDTTMINWKLLNLDGSLFTSGSFPSFFKDSFPKGPETILASEKLFDSDDEIELLFYSTEKIIGGGSYTLNDIYVLNANSNIAFHKANYSLIDIFNTSNNSIMILKKQINFEANLGSITYIGTLPNSDSTLVYTLPGKLACDNCSLTSLKEFSNIGKNTTFNVFPNPQKEQSVIEYAIPSDIKNKRIEVYSLKGILIKKIELTENTGRIELTDLNISSGIYLYSIIGDGALLGNQKIIKIN
jgi:hypothetical protein